MEEIYKITVNKTQMQLIAEALEMHSRLICGQLGESYMPPIRDMLYKIYDEVSSDTYQEKKNKVEMLLNSLKRELWGLEDNASYGVGYNKEADLGYEMYKCILHQFWKDNGDGSSVSVHSSLPLDLTEHKFIEIEKL